VSGDANGLTVDLKGAVDRNVIDDVGVPAGAELLAFTNAVQIGDRDVDKTRAALVAAVGEEATIEAAATVAIFNGLVRVADGTGIKLDAGVFAASIEERDYLDLNAFTGAANSADVQRIEGRAPSAVNELFG